MTGAGLLVVAALSDPVKNPGRVIFTVVMLGGASAFAAFAWELYSPARPKIEQIPTETARPRKKRKKVLSIRIHPNGTRETCLSQEEEEG